LVTVTVAGALVAPVGVDGNAAAVGVTVAWAGGAIAIPTGPPAPVMKLWLTLVPSRLASPIVPVSKLVQ
jgi:hypothetical protein